MLLWGSLSHISITGCKKSALMDRYLTHSTCAAEFLKGRILDRFYLSYIYASKLFNIIEHELPSVHYYAYGTQL